MPGSSAGSSSPAPSRSIWDAQGRFVLPSYLREAAGLEGEAVVVGSLDHAEIWTPAGWDDYRKALEDARRARAALLGAGHLAALHALPGSARDPLVDGGDDMEEGHRPVLAEEVMKMLAPRPGSLHVDCTVGGGGHTERILEAASPDGRVLGLDADPAAIARVGERLARFGDRLVLRQANFRALGEVAPDAGFAAVDGILLDLGLSSFQLADAGRGFGFRAGGPLDMRFDPSRGEPAVGAAGDASTRTRSPTLFRRYGEEPHARRIARAIVERPPRRADRDRRAAGGRRGAGRPAPPAARAAGSIPPPASSRRSGSPSTASWTRSEAVLAASLGPPAPGRAPRRAQLPLAGGPHRQALRRRGAPRLHLSPELSRLRLRPGASSPLRRPPAGGPVRRRGRRQSPCPERPAPDRRAARSMSRARRREGGHRR